MQGTQEHTFLERRRAFIASRVDEGQELIRHQRHRIYFLGRGGHNTLIAESILARLEASHSKRIAEREQLERLLAALEVNG